MSVYIWYYNVEYISSSGSWSRQCEKHFSQAANPSICNLPPHGWGQLTSPQGQTQHPLYPKQEKGSQIPKNNTVIEIEVHTYLHIVNVVLFPTLQRKKACARPRGRRFETVPDYKRRSTQGLWELSVDAAFLQSSKYSGWPRRDKNGKDMAWKRFHKGPHKAIYLLIFLLLWQSCYDKHIPLIDITGPFKK